MRTLLYTAHNDAYAPLAAYTVPRMSEYAFKHGMEFMRYNEPLDDLPDAIYWLKFVAARILLKVYERIIWLDVDQLITNMEFSLEDHFINFKHGFHAPMDWGEDAVADSDCSACGLVMHPDISPLVDEILSMRPESAGKPFPEQNPMRAVMKRYQQSTPLGRPVYPWPRKPLNAVPDAVCPGKVVNPWKPGDFAAHLTMLSIDERVKLAKEILKEL